MVDIFFGAREEEWIMEDVEKIAKLEVAKYTNQIMVVAVSEDGANLCLYEREDSTGQAEKKNWQLVLETEAIIGKNGLGKKKEGDGKTPVGVFRFTKAFGILENPGANMEYTQVNKSHYWVDDSDSNYYNQFVSTEEVTLDWSSAEHILDYGKSYHYVLATSYNLERIPGKGSAVFLHCTSEKSEVTAGCVAVPEVYMREIMRRVKQDCVLIIDRTENVLTY
jgi:L,D-peptidoglycan transpeptidase YkuD (ErfK/YbiS/YcfS/YnhG family)